VNRLLREAGAGEVVADVQAGAGQASPLPRAFQGERITDVEMVIAPRDRSPRTLVCNGQALLARSGRGTGVRATP